MATHPSILAWKIPWAEEPGRLQSMGSQRVRHNWAQIRIRRTRSPEGPKAGRSPLELKLLELEDGSWVTPWELKQWDSGNVGLTPGLEEWWRQAQLAHSIGVTKGFPGSAVGKESVCTAGDFGPIPGLGRSPGEGKGYPLQYSGLENSMDSLVQHMMLPYSLISASSWVMFSRSWPWDEDVCASDLLRKGSKEKVQEWGSTLGKRKKPGQANES